MSPVPPPPPPPPTNFSVNNGANKKISAIPNTSALLKSIEKGTKLKKTTTNDRSAPQTSTQPNSSVPNRSNQKLDSYDKAGNALAPSGLGGLFANGFPTLKSSKCKTTEDVKVPQALQKPVSKAISQARESITRDPKKSINIASKGFKMAAPVLSSEPKDLKSTDKPVKNLASTVGLPRKANVLPELPKKAEKKMESSWNFPIENEEFLPSPRNFSRIKKKYLSQCKKIEQEEKSASETQISNEDMKGFIKSLKSKLSKAAKDENFEECVRLKSKLKSFESIDSRIKSGEKVYLSELPR